MAWLHARPKNEERARQKIFEDEEHEIEMPDCDAQYIIEYLFDLGLSIGEHALTHTEIQSWQQNTGTILEAWESRFLKKLSSIYLSEYKESTDSEKETVWESAPHYMSMAYRKMIKSKESLRKLAQ